MDILDESSGAYSWEAFASFATVALAQAKRREGAVSLLIVGSDPLPALSIPGGLSLEATALLVLASALLRVIRGGDLVGRHGPTTFALLAHDAPAAGAARLAERIHDATPKALSSPRGPLPLTISVGIATMPEAGTTLPELLHQAEEAFQAAVRSGGNGVYLGAVDSVAPDSGSGLAAVRREELARLMQAYERREVEGIVIRTRTGACSVCADAGRDMHRPHLAPLPTLPLNGCTNPRGCRCLYTSPEKDPRRHPPEVPALAAGKLDIPRRLRHASQFGGNPKKACKPDELAEYLETFPLLPITCSLVLQPGESAYLVQPASRAHQYPTAHMAGSPAPHFPFEGPLRPWVRQPGKPVSLSKDALWDQMDGRLCLTNWRLLFSSAGAVESILLADVIDVEYLANGIACRVSGDGRRAVFLLRDPLLCGLYIAKAIRDFTLVAG